MNPSTTQPQSDVELQRVQWTTSDLEGFPDNGNRYELIDGKLFVTHMLPWEHQRLVGEVCITLQKWSKQTGLGQASFSPGIVYSKSDCVIPDAVWVSTKRLELLLDDKSGHLTGSPELVVEVLSRSEADRKRDRETKLKFYSTEGVLEYWIVDSEQHQLEVYRQNQGILVQAMTLYATDQLTSPLLPDFTWSLASLFA